MTVARLTIDREFVVAPVRPRLFGSFLEQMGRAVYTGVYEPGHPTADEKGFRTDVLELTREVGPSIVRWPGGNFVSGYAWEDGIGPRESRPTRLDRGWRTVETNEFGLHEFIDWSRAAGAEPMLALNLGTRGVQEASDLLEYANHPGGSRWSDLRRANGAPEPFGVRTWCLGNEMDGPWQIGHKTAHEYGRLAAETGRVMRMFDPGIELVACGSSTRQMATFGAWEQTVLELCYDQVDLVSAHAYYEETDDVPVGDFLASALDMDAFVAEVVATVDAVRARGRHRSRVDISFDEWNVWYTTRWAASDRARAVSAWDRTPRVIEDEYSLTDAVVVGSLLNVLVRHADRIAVGCQAQLVNVIGMLRSEPGGAAWKQTIALPFEEVRRRTAGTEALDVRITSDRYDAGRYGDADVVDAAAVTDPETGAVTLFLVNRGLTEAADVTVSVHGFPELAVGEARVLTAGPGQDRHTTNDEAHPDRVRLRPLTGCTVHGAEGRQTAGLRLPALSWACISLVPAGS